MTLETPTVRGRRRNLWVAWVLGAAAAIIGVVALLGGFNEVPIEKLPRIELGDSYAGNEVDTIITGSYLTFQQPGQIFSADEEALQQQPQPARGRHRSGCRIRPIPAVPDRLHAEVDEVRGPDDLDAGEEHGGLRDDDADPERHGDDRDKAAERVADHAQQAADATE